MNVKITEDGDDDDEVHDDDDEVHDDSLSQLFQVEREREYVLHIKSNSTL